MAARGWHYAKAESLLTHGQEVIDRIGRLADERDRLRVLLDNPPDPALRQDVIDKITEQMDELGKKAMGIWAQAQVHATLANTDPSVEVEALDFHPQPTSLPTAADATEVPY